MGHRNQAKTVFMGGRDEPGQDEDIIKLDFGVFSQSGNDRVENQSTFRRHN
jgi:hypothetical protein